MKPIIVILSPRRLFLPGREGLPDYSGNPVKHRGQRENLQPA